MVLTLDFADSPEEAVVRTEAEAWLSANAKLRKSSSTDLMRSYRPKTEEAEGQLIQRAKDWQAKKADERWAAAHWPVEFGGKGLSGHLAAIFVELEQRYDVPGRTFQVGVEMVGPTIIQHGTERQKNRYLKPILYGEEIWCQLFSEPNAGSDLAAIATKAERDGEVFSSHRPKGVDHGGSFLGFRYLVGAH